MCDPDPAGIDAEQAVDTAHTVFLTATRELLANGEYEAATRTIRRWLNSLDDIGALDVAGDIETALPTEQDVDLDRTIIHELTEKDREHLNRLARAAEASTASTRVDVNGDDLPAEALGFADGETNTD